MKTRKWIALASAAATLVSLGACKPSQNAGQNTAASPEAQGRRGTNPPRTGADQTSPSGTSGTAGAAGSTTQTTSGTSSGENADRAPATGTTPGGQGQAPSNGTGTDSSGSTNR